MKKRLRLCVLAAPVLCLVACADNGSARSDWLSSSNPPIASTTPGGGTEGYYWYGDQGRPAHMDSSYRQDSAYRQPTTNPNSNRTSPSPANNTGPR